MSLIIDAIIILALAGAVGYGLVLSNRLARLMEILRDLEPAITAFSQAVDKSESSATGLRAAAIKLAEEVGEARGARAQPQPRRAVPRIAPAAADADKSDLVRGFFTALQARDGA